MRSNRSFALGLTRLDQIYILTCHGWLAVATFELSTRIPSGTVSPLPDHHSRPNSDMYGRTCGESQQDGSKQRMAEAFFRVGSLHLLMNRGPDPFQDDRVIPPQSPHLPLVRSDASKPHPRSGLVQLEWNLDGTFLLARFGMLIDISPNCWFELNLSWHRTVSQRIAHLFFPAA